MSQPATANAPLRAITARWLVPLDRPPLAHGVLWVRGGRIVGIEPRRALQPVEDLGEVAIVPGLINAHTHLELSPHAQPIGPPGISFSQWLTQVIAWRRQWLDASDPHAMAARRQAALQAGLAELTAGGTVAVGEIAYPGFPEEVYQACPLAGRLFLELLGVEAAQVPQQMALARRHLARWTARGGSLRGGLSPHAPYSVHPELLQQAVALAAEADVPVAMHLAESPEEIELLASNRGPLAEVLQMRGVCPGEYLPAAVRPLDYLKTLSRAPQALVIHGNYLGPPEIAFLADHRQRMTVVYCPRTRGGGHRFPGYQPRPEPVARTGTHRPAPPRSASRNDPGDGHPAGGRGAGSGRRTGQPGAGQASRLDRHSTGQRRVRSVGSSIRWRPAAETFAAGHGDELIASPGFGRCDASPRVQGSGRRTLGR